MPSTSVIIEGNRLFRYNDKTDAKEPVSNPFSFAVGICAFSSEAGGPGILMRIQRYPDNVNE